MSFRPVDEAARERARRDLSMSLVVEAGAGTGKTTLLVDRIESLIRSGTARLDQVAAVTFTENAATTMKLRLRERLEAARVDPDLPREERGRAADALEVLERAPICTIHALCAALLQERPLECGVVPGFRTADEAEADILFARAWEEWLGERLTHGDDVLLDALDRGVPLEALTTWGERTSLRGLARVLLEQRDLQPLVADRAFDPAAARAELQARAARGRELAEGAQPGDALAERLRGLVSHAEAARFLEGPKLIEHLLSPPSVPRNFGHRPRWPSTEALEEARGIAAWVKESAEGWRAARGADVHGRLVRALADVTAIYERRKAESGVLDFLDLLLKARDALRDRPAVRAYFQQRWPHLIIDEFQDTDPLQVEIARLLSGDRPGALVVVGDAKQSIYRFRRAEVRLFRELADEARAAEGRDVVRLSQSFRSRPAILRFVNRVFADLIQSSEEAGQPPYEPIDPPPGLPDDPSVVALRFPAPSAATGDDLLLAEAGALATFLGEAARGAHPVRDPATGRVRPSRAGDVLVLSRRLTKVRFLEEAFEAAGLRFTVEGGKSFFDRQEVHETLAVLRAIDDPSDPVSLVAALRSSFFGVSDRDVVAYSLSGGLPAMGAVDEERPGAAALGPALALLEELHRGRTRWSVPALLDHVYDETRVLAGLTGTRRGEAQVANLEKVATLARQAADLGALTLRGFVNLLAERVDSAREEPDLPSTRPGDPDTLRVLSVHKAKGLEAPIVALYDTADRAWFSADTIPLWDEGRIAVGFREGCQPEGWAQLVQRERKKAWAENRRLLYVACTRARDLLVIPRPPVDAALGDFWRDLIQRLPQSSDADVRVVDAETLQVPEHESQRAELWALAGAEGGDAVAARWEKERRERIEAAAERHPRPIGVTALAAREEERTPAVALAEGRATGRDFGQLVHRLLEWVPFGEDEADRRKRLERMASAYAPSLGLDEEAARRAWQQVDRVLGLPVIDRARRARRAWRELKLWFPDGGFLVEGQADLVFEEDGGLVVVDYKSDAITEDQAQQQAAFHAPQLQLYGRGLSQALGQPVRERLVLFTALGRTVPV
jgi:ATP-dependent helicase/nuclease subunit A